MNYKKLFVSNTPQMQKLLDSIPDIALTGVNILIQAESGTGKEVLANLIHQCGSRSTKPLVVLNCAAIPEHLLESELFGHKRGAFTGATSDHKGVFEAADGGILFLDEIGDMPLNLQAKLLRVLQSKEIRPVGCTSERKVDFNLISATHRNLKSEIKMGRFREDLYYRLDVIPLTIPPLRQRPDDIPMLINCILDNLSVKYKIAKRKFFSPAAIENLMKRRWTGNIRQLENLVAQCIVINQTKEVIDVMDLPEDPDVDELSTHANGQVPNFQSLPTVSALTDDYIRYVLGQVNFHQGEAARILGISRRTICRKLSPKDHPRCENKML